jgi:hypothetical protein
MASRWLESIRGNRQLSVFPGGSLAGSWPTVFNSALQEFNKLSGSLGLGVTLTRSTAPVNRFLTGANVQFEAAVNAFTFNDTFLGPQTVSLTGSAAKTRPLPSASNGGRLGQALILVPLAPKVLAGPTGQRTLREAGDPIKLVIAVHELIHACGLDDSDHTPLGDPDVFVSPIVDDADPVDPAKDREDAGTKNGVHVKLPPIILSPQTALKIQFLWLVPNPVIHFPHTF